MLLNGIEFQEDLLHSFKPCLLAFCRRFLARRPRLFARRGEGSSQGTNLILLRLVRRLLLLLRLCVLLAAVALILVLVLFLFLLLLLRGRVVHPRALLGSLHVRVQEEAPRAGPPRLSEKIEELVVALLLLPADLIKIGAFFS